MALQIACIHQGYELYGSDRSFIESVKALREAYPRAQIEVVLPRPGPIVPALELLADRVLFEPLFVLRRRSLGKLAAMGAVLLPAAIWRAARRLRRCDLVYINTSVIVDHALAARLSPGKALLHVHELPDGLVRTVLRSLVLGSGCELVFNSHATKAAFAPPPSRRSHVIYNGVAGPASAEIPTYDGLRPLRVLLLGRIGPIKGQEVLLDALALLPPEIGARIEVRMVGGAFENDALETALKDRVDAMGLSDRVGIEPFAPDPSSLYRWADVVVIPSRRPESLGRVAIEAMAWGRPPIASRIGGLVEVVEHERTGWLVPPAEPQALADTLAKIVAKPESLAPLVAAGRARYEALFSEEAAAQAIVAVTSAMLAERGVTA